MNRERFQQIVDNYLARFEELNGPVHKEYYKWQIAYQFKPLMNDAIDASEKEFPTKLYAVKKLTQNLIDSYTQPFNGLVEFSKKEPKTVQGMFQSLFQSAEAAVQEKQATIQDFLDRSHMLRDRYFPDSYLYNDDFHSVTGYLFLYDPDHNYLYEASHCRSFADCVEFYDDWGYGADTKLDVFSRMCDETVSLIKNNEALLAVNASRYEIDPNRMHPDQEKHILLFDLIYCCTTYGLFRSISYISPKTGERKLIQERKEKAKELSNKLAEAQEQLALLNRATEWLSKMLKPGRIVWHRSFGEGIIQDVTDSAIIVQFSSVGQKTLGTAMCVSNRLISFGDEKTQAELLSYNAVLQREKQILNAVQWAEKELIPYAEYL